MFLNTVLLNCTTESDRNLWIKVAEYVTAIVAYARTVPDRWDFPFGCHTICRAIAMAVPDLRVIDGTYIGLAPDRENGSFHIMECEHSWLVTPHNAVIDPYPVGILCPMPILVAPRGRYKPFGSEYYCPAKPSAQKILNRKIHRQATILARIYERSKNGNTQLAYAIQ